MLPVSNSEDYVTVKDEKEVKKETKVKFGEIKMDEIKMHEGDESGDESQIDNSEEFESDGKRYTKTTDRRNTGVPLVKMPIDYDSDDETSPASKSTIKTETISTTEFESHGSHDSHGHEQDWKKVDMVAWILLLCIAFECLIEGIAFALTLSDELGAGIAILAAMIIKLIPQKLGDAVILR